MSTHRAAVCPDGSDEPAHKSHCGPLRFGAGEMPSVKAAELNTGFIRDTRSRPKGPTGFLTNWARITDLEDTWMETCQSIP